VPVGYRRNNFPISTYFVIDHTLWDASVIDPSLEKDGDPDHNLHQELPDWVPVDFADFLKKVCQLWNVDLEKERELL
jgi:hypothetical protein